MGPWRCDSCRKMIESAGDGWVEWLIDFNSKEDEEEQKKYGLRIVHNTEKCQYDERTIKEGVLHDHLEEYLGHNGLMDLLEMIDDKEFPTEEVVEVVKRLHIKGYEQARDYFQDAIDKGVIEINAKEGFYSQNQIEAVIEWSKNKQES